MEVLSKAGGYEGFIVMLHLYLYIAELNLCNPTYSTQPFTVIYASLFRPLASV